MYCSYTICIHYNRCTLCGAVRKNWKLAHSQQHKAIWINFITLDLDKSSPQLLSRIDKTKVDPNPCVPHSTFWKDPSSPCQKSLGLKLIRWDFAFNSFNDSALGQGAFAVGTKSVVTACTCAWVLSVKDNATSSLGESQYIWLKTMPPIKRHTLIISDIWHGKATSASVSSWNNGPHHNQGHSKLIFSIDNKNISRGWVHSQSIPRLDFPRGTEPPDKRAR